MCHLFQVFSLVLKKVTEKIAYKYFRPYCVYFERVSHSLFIITESKEGTAVAQWLRCCATNRKVAGSIPAGVIGIFH